MKTTINNLGQHGIIKDVVGTGLPLNAWSGGNNVRCNDNWIGSIGGHESLTTVVNGKYLVGYPNGNNFTWIYAADTTGDGTTERLYSYDGTISTNISGMTYTASDWNGCILNSIVIMNNGTDNPQYWNGSGTFANLIYDGATDWATQGYAAKVIRAYKNFLFALDITDSGTNYPHLIHWSNPADPGNIPDSWDYTSTTNESGRNELSETPGFLVDAIPLRDSLVIYKEDAIVLANYIGGTFQFSFQYLSNRYGLLGQDCAVEAIGERASQC